MDLDNSPQPPREVLAHYARGQEDERLEREEGKLESCRTEELLLRHLPAPPAVVLDVGGGTGQYATWLGARGYRVSAGATRAGLTGQPNKSMPSSCSDRCIT